VGQSADDVLAALDRAGVLLESRRPPATGGRVLGQVQRVAASGPPTPDPTVRTVPAGKPTYMAWVIYALTSIPAPA
jgi:hypothetical protein